MMQPFWRRKPSPPPESDAERERRWREERRQTQERLARIAAELEAFPDFAAVVADTARKERAGHAD